MADRTRPSIRTRGNALFRPLDLAEQIVGSLLLALILGLVVLQAAQRYLPGGSWVWTGEIARYALVWLTFAVVGHLAWSWGHIAIEVVDNVARGWALAVIKRLADAVIAVASAAFFMDTWDEVADESTQVTPAAGLPIQLLYLLPLIGFGITTLRAGWAAIVGRPPEEAPTAEGSHG